MALTPTLAKNTYISFNGVDISLAVSNSDFERTADSLDITCYGSNSKAKSGGLKDAKFTMEGTYDTTAGTGPRAVIRPQIGNIVTVIRRPEGTGSGKPQDSFSAVVTSYKESSPVADNVKWTCDMDVSGDVTTTTQP